MSMMPIGELHLSRQLKQVTTWFMFFKILKKTFTQKTFSFVSRPGPLRGLFELVTIEDTYSFSNSLLTRLLFSQLNSVHQFGLRNFHVEMRWLLNDFVGFRLILYSRAADKFVTTWLFHINP